MHSSRMRTGRSLTVDGVCFGGVAVSGHRGVCVWSRWGGVSGPGVSGPEGCLVLGGVWSPGGVWFQGGPVPGGVWSGGGSGPGGLLQGGCLRQTPPVNRMNDRQV